uniref:Adaptor AP-1 19 kDa protein n=1 Tax=Oryza glumipatula TaxID=40148 RepID=A0A0D9ZEU4_9ORYZ
MHVCTEERKGNPCKRIIGGPMTSIIRPQLLCPLLRISLSQGKKKNLLSAEIVSTAGEPSKPELTSATAVARHDTFCAPHQQTREGEADQMVQSISSEGKIQVSTLVLTRGPKMCNFVDWHGYRVVYKRYASLYFCMCIDAADNELETLQIIHHFVEILDRYFGNVCELDLIFNFHKAYFILDEVLIAGELQESNKKAVLRLITTQDNLVEAAKEEASSLRNIIAQATK